jgi:hypothetical protein
MLASLCRIGIVHTKGEMQCMFGVSHGFWISLRYERRHATSTYIAYIAHTCPHNRSTLCSTLAACCQTCRPAYTCSHTNGMLAPRYSRTNGWSCNCFALAAQHQIIMPHNSRQGCAFCSGNRVGPESSSRGEPDTSGGGSGPNSDPDTPFFARDM